MPDYEYQCAECGKRFILTLSIKEHENQEVKCPDCKTKNVKPILSSFFAKTSKKS